jgi:ribosomal protein L31E
MIDDSTENEYTINLRFKVCMESAFECNRDIEILRNHVVKRKCEFKPTFQIPGNSTIKRHPHI